MFLSVGHISFCRSYFCPYLSVCQPVGPLLSICLSISQSVICCSIHLCVGQSESVICCSVNLSGFCLSVHLHLHLYGRLLTCPPITLSVHSPLLCMCVCVCVCVCVVGMVACVCVCVHICVGVRVGVWGWGCGGGVCTYVCVRVCVSQFSLVDINAKCLVLTLLSLVL